SVLCRAETDHAALWWTLLFLQERRGSAPLQSAFAQCRPDSRAVRLRWALPLMVRSAARPRVSNHEARLWPHPSRRGPKATPQDEGRRTATPALSAPVQTC